MGGRPGEPDRGAEASRSPALRPGQRGHLRRARRGRTRRDRWRAGSASRPEGSAARSAVMIGPNLSDWALKHRSFIVFAMLAITIAGITSYYGLGRSEDPAFTFRTMVVQA